MKIVEVSRFGPPSVLRVGEAPAPEPGPGEVAIDVDVVEVLFLDTQLRSGWGSTFFPMRPPWVPGTGVVGTVVAVGEDSDDAVLGTTVVARTGDSGAYAERVVVAAAEAIPVPVGVESAAAVAALHDGVLALDRLDRVELGDGSRVLVTAAAGGAALWFVGLAARTGAHVTAVAGGPAKTAAVSAAGADRVLDHRRGGWRGDLGGPFDVVFEGAGGDTAVLALEHTRDGGTFCAHGAASGGFGVSGSERGITVVGVEAVIADERWRALVRRGLGLVEAGVVRPVIGQRVTLAEAAAAHAAIERREVVGKTVLVT